MSAISFKTLTQDDVTTSRTLLHEAIPITGTLISGTYNTTLNSDNVERESNIKTFSHGMLQSVYDYPYVSSSANHIFDITFGMHPTDPDYHDGLVLVQTKKKVNVYNQMAQILVGYDVDGNIKRFDSSPSVGADDDTGIFHSCWFLTFSRLLVKDEIKKGSFELKLGVGLTYADPFDDVITLTDADSASNYRSSSPAGEFGFLKDSMGTIQGLIYYQAGIVALWGSNGVFSNLPHTDNDPDNPATARSEPKTINGIATDPNFAGVGDAASSEGDASMAKWRTIDVCADSLRNRIQNIKFNNTTELNSTIYFCRANKGEFNYSSNPTYLDGSKIRVKADPGTNEFQNPPLSYVTTIGLYSPDNVLLAVAKLSEPVKKTPINELNFRVRLDY